MTVKVLPLAVSDIRVGVFLLVGKQRVKIVGVRGARTVSVRPAAGWPISQRAEANGVRLDTLLRDYVLDVNQTP